MSDVRFTPRTEPTLQAAWASAYRAMLDRPGREIAPFAVTVDRPAGLSLASTEADPLVRALDAALAAAGQQSVERVAFTLFPERLWRLHAGGRHQFYCFGGKEGYSRRR